MSIHITTESPNKYSHKAIFSKMVKFDVLRGFSNFQNWIFCHFWFSHKFFFELQTNFCFPQKISRLLVVSQIQQKSWTLWGGGGTTLFPPENQKSDFASIIVKRKVFRFKFCWKKSRLGFCPQKVTKLCSKFFLGNFSKKRVFFLFWSLNLEQTKNLIKNRLRYVF